MHAACWTAALAQAAIQRLPLRQIKFVAPCGRGSYAQCDLVSVLGKLCVRKSFWVPAEGQQPAAPTTRAAAPGGSPMAAAGGAAVGLAQALPPAAACSGTGIAGLKATTLAEYKRERDLHQLAAGSAGGTPFIVQLLAAKAGKANDYSLYMEWAYHGSLAGLIKAAASTSASARHQPAPGSSAPGACAPSPAAAAADARQSAPMVVLCQDEDVLRFYTACIIMALERLHGHRILHRDIKPDNVLLRAGAPPRPPPPPTPPPRPPADGPGATALRLTRCIRRVRQAVQPHRRQATSHGRRSSRAGWLPCPAPQMAMQCWPTWGAPARCQRGTTPAAARGRPLTCRPR